MRGAGGVGLGTAGDKGPPESALQSSRRWRGEADNSERPASERGALPASCKAF